MILGLGANHGAGAALRDSDFFVFAGEPPPGFVFSKDHAVCSSVSSVSLCVAAVMKSEVKGAEDAQYETKESVMVARARVQARVLSQPAPRPPPQRRHQARMTH